MKYARHMSIVAGLVAASAMLPSQPAFADPLYTYNSTNRWIWVTIYDVTKTMHMDWGWVGPHNLRVWTGGGSPTPMTYMGGSYYFVRAEVKPGGPQDTANIFDTTVEVNPPFTHTDYTGRVLCLAPQATAKSFYWDYDSHCIVATDSHSGYAGQFAVGIARPPTPAPVHSANEVPLQPTPHPQPATVSLTATDVQGPFGPNSAVHQVKISVDGKVQPLTLAKLGKWSTSTPEAIQITDDSGGFRALKAGTGDVTWTYGGKTYNTTVHAQ